MLIFKSEDLTGKKILEKSPSRVKAKGKILKIGTQSDDERGSSKPSSERDSELDELKILKILFKKLHSRT